MEFWEEAYWEKMFWQGWHGPLHVLVAGGLAYLSLLAMLRLSGKRTLSRFSAFDVVITMALGSILGRAVVDQDIALADSLVAFMLLIGLQISISWLEIRSKFACRLINDEPTLLFHDGKFLRKAMYRERVGKMDIEAAMHEKGILSLELVESVILGCNGKLGVVMKEPHATRHVTSNTVPEGK